MGNAQSLTEGEVTRYELCLMRLDWKLPRSANNSSNTYTWRTVKLTREQDHGFTEELFGDAQMESHSNQLSCW